MIGHGHLKSSSSLTDLRGSSGSLPIEDGSSGIPQSAASPLSSPTAASIDLRHGRSLELLQVLRQDLLPKAVALTAERHEGAKKLGPD